MNYEALAATILLAGFSFLVFGTAYIIYKLPKINKGIKEEIEDYFLDEYQLEENKRSLEIAIKDYYNEIKTIAKNEMENAKNELKNNLENNLTEITKIKEEIKEIEEQIKQMEKRLIDKNVENKLLTKQLIKYKNIAQRKEKQAKQINQEIKEA